MAILRLHAKFKSYGGGSTKFGWLADSFTMDGFERALNGIKFIMFKCLPEETAKWYLIGIFNEIMSTRRILVSWLRTNVVPILKSKKDPELTDSYIPISLLPCARKLLEKILCTRLDNWTKKHDVASTVFEKAGERRIV
jgi:hypothetical protein